MLTGRISREHGVYVKKSGEGSGIIDTFTLEETINNDGEIKKFRIEGKYLDIGTEIETKKMDTATYSETTDSPVVSNVECCRIEHTVTVLQDDTGESETGSSSTVVLWIPTGDVKTDINYFWIYPKSEYIDAEGNVASWSYYVTEEMQQEMNNGSFMYLPHTQGDFYGSSEWAFHDLFEWAWGLYGWGWAQFAGWAEGGEQYFEEDNFSFGGISYSCSKTVETVGNYSFNAWKITRSFSFGGEFAEWRTTLSPDLPLPIYLKVGGSNDGDNSYSEYELKDITLA